NTHLHPQESNLAKILKNAGYKTGIVGKWDYPIKHSSNFSEKH
ncbi:MAG: sulfatase-like hydrolase/transferase, partial [Calditrichae bacterium]|nr:sulfatase-like hydrolase/transferase [Calditrichia bacterium]